MDLTTTTPTNKISDAENETPPQTQPNTKSLSFTNNALNLKHHHHHHHLTAISAPPAAVVTYRECLKNHAASLGGHAVDGCCEYLPSPTANPTDRTSLKCAACGCHRNFHRRESDYITTTTTHILDFRRHPPLPRPQLPRRNSPSTSPSSSPSQSPPPPPPPLPPSSYYPSTPHMLLALSNAVQGRPTMNHHPVTPMAAKAENPSGRKRFRTKFSQEQKEKMLSFSERLGWKMQRCDEGLVEAFCNEVGVGKGVLKVWMHNNKHTFGKRETNTNTTTTTTTTTTTNTNNNNYNSSDRVINCDINGHIDNTNKNNSDYHDDSSGAHLHDSSTDGSSSSS